MFIDTFVCSTKKNNIMLDMSPYKCILLLFIIIKMFIMVIEEGVKITMPLNL